MFSNQLNYKDCATRYRVVVAKCNAGQRLHHSNQTPQESALASRLCPSSVAATLATLPSISVMLLSSVPGFLISFSHSATPIF